MSKIDGLIQPIWGIAPYPIALIKLHGRPHERKFSYVNPAFTTLTGYASAEAIGRPASLLDGPKTTPGALQEWEMAIVQRQPTTITFVHYRKDRSEYVARTSCAPLVEADGTSEYLILLETPIEGQDLPLATASAAQQGATVPLSLPMPLKEFPDGVLPQHLLIHPELDALQTLWQELRGDRPLPLRSDFDLRRVSQWAPNLSIATVLPTGRFQFRLFGSELAGVYGRDLTGRFLDELTPRDLWSVITLHYQEVLRTRQPLFAPISIANGRWYSEVSRLLLPLALEGAGEKVDFIMGADYTRF